MVVVEGSVDFWNETRRHRIPHIMITLRGIFNRENNLRWHCIPIGDNSKSGIPSRRWITRLLRRRVELEGCTKGYLFARPNGDKASLGDYNPLFRDYMERTKTRFSERFSKGVDIREYSLRRSPRRGATTHAANNKVDETTTELVSRWRKREKAKGAEPGLSMRQVYTQVSSALEAQVRYSLSH